MKYVLGFLAVVAISVPVSLLGGVVLSDFWKWFIEPVFSVPPLTYLQAVGLSLFVGFFKIGMKSAFGDGEEESIAKSFAQLAAYVVAYLLAWGIGAVWHVFM